MVAMRFLNALNAAHNVLFTERATKKKMANLFLSGADRHVPTIIKMILNDVVYLIFGN